ncbi:UDP-Gal:betaGlcNAc beta 1,4- galactosyltransferase, polypeptide 1, gene 1 isoform X1 [Xenopus tropicalis]|uniref:Beta-1,4-galactosyltransferase n=2 Tax=Xenopus tropicalis TaxID=8364 RepID=A0A803JHY3_XENTR|nr:UDP-Gal:betaGlcNAc beta 1,4- galactosyltransferase, polypeptide 1, gene 1 isoform X1 [Xenopus tropicalis]
MLLNLPKSKETIRKFVFGTMKEPLLPSSTITAALPGASLQKACKFLVVFCSLHLCVTLFYYLSGGDFRIFQYFSVNQQQRPPEIHPTYSIPLTTTVARELPRCAEISPLLRGPLTIDFNVHVNLTEDIKANPKVTEGGHYKPSDCKALQKVAIIIPFRNRDSHLKYWLHYMHPILQRQQLDYGVYVINQDGDNTFNRAKLMNIGYAESLKEYDYNCFVFSDVDIVIMDDKNLYRCFNQPRHLSVAMDKFGFGLPYHQYFGGVSALSKEQFRRINGFPNTYWGWGGEDDDIYNRIVAKGMSISRPDATTGKCRMIKHNRDEKNGDNPKRFDLISRTRHTMEKDGINSLSYKVVKKEKFPLYVKITVDAGIPS